MKSAKETQIKHIRDSEPDRLFMCLDHLQDGDMLVISGSVPASLSADLHERIMKRVQGKVIRIIVNAAGELLNGGAEAPSVPDQTESSRAGRSVRRTDRCAPGCFPLCPAAAGDGRAECPGFHGRIRRFADRGRWP